MPKDKYVGKVIRVYLPNTKRPKYRWFIKKREDGRYVVRAPKRGVYFRDLDKKRENDFLLMRVCVWRSGTGVPCGQALNAFECRRVWHSPCLGRLGAIRFQDCVQLYN